MERIVVIEGVVFNLDHLIAVDECDWKDSMSNIVHGCKVWMMGKLSKEFPMKPTELFEIIRRQVESGNAI